jgi:hypothetical protein
LVALGSSATFDRIVRPTVRDRAEPVQCVGRVVPWNIGQLDNRLGSAVMFWQYSSDLDGAICNTAWKGVSSYQQDNFLPTHPLDLTTTNRHQILPLCYLIIDTRKSKFVSRLFPRPAARLVGQPMML